MASKNFEKNTSRKPKEEYGERKKPLKTKPRRRTAHETSIEEGMGTVDIRIPKVRAEEDTQVLKKSASAPTEPMPAMPHSWNVVRESTKGNPKSWEEIERVASERTAKSTESPKTKTEKERKQEVQAKIARFKENLEKLKQQGYLEDALPIAKHQQDIELLTEEKNNLPESEKGKLAKIEAKIEIHNLELKKLFQKRLEASSATTQPMPVEEIEDLSLEDEILETVPTAHEEPTPVVKLEEPAPIAEPEEPALKIKEEVEVKEEIKNLTPEEKEKIGWGLGTLGFKVEKAKNDFFAAAFNPDTMHPFLDNKKGTLRRFCKELSSSFARDSKEAEKKAKAISSGKEKHRLSNAGLLAGNVLKYGRIVADVTGASMANPFRYVMMGGMMGARMSEAGKEARFKNEDVIEKTRIENAEKAYDEAMAIYMKAQDKEGSPNVSAEALKNAYLTEMPKDLQQRLENPSTANGFVQKIIKTQIGFSLERLQKKIEKIELGGKSKAEKEKATDKLLKKWEKDLKDYDRAITQYGTVDGLAMAGRYIEKTSKGVVLGMQIETALVSGSRLWETVSHLWNHSSDVHSAVSSVAEHHNTAPAASEVTKPAAIAIEKTAEIPSTPVPAAAINNLLNKEIKFEQGKGGIAAVYEALKLKNPETTYAQAVKEAIKFGLYDPNNPNESALIQQGSTLKFDDAGNLIFHDVKTGEDVTHYAGKMFDAHQHAAPVHVETEHVAADKTVGLETEKTPEMQTEEHIQNFREQENEIKNRDQSRPIFHADEEDTHTEKGGSRATEDLREEIIKKMEVKRPSNVISVGTRVETGTTKLYTDTTIMDTGTTEMGTGGIRIINGPIERFDYNVSEFAHTFPELSRVDHLALETHPEFGDNDFQLSGEKLMDAYHASEKNVSFLFRQYGENTWSDIKTLKAGKLLVDTTEKSNPAVTRLSDYVRLLRNFTELKPNTGFLGLGGENAEHYIARALQKAAALGKLKDIQESIRK